MTDAYFSAMSEERFCFGKAFWADGLEIHVLVFVGSDSKPLSS